MARRKKALKLILAKSAETDLLHIWLWNTGDKSPTRADAYIRFVKGVLDKLCAEPHLGKPVDDRPGLFRFTIQQRSKKHGHIAFFCLSDDELLVTRILHTAQNWPEII